MSDDYQPLNDASPFDFSKPSMPFSSLDNERPFVVHEADDGTPEPLIGQLGELHQDIFDSHDVGPILLRGYIDHTGEPTIERGDENYLPLVEKHMEHLQGIEDWPSEHTAGVTDKKWVYLNGEVGFGPFHHQIMQALTHRQKMPEMEKGLLTNLALANAHPGDIKHDVAWGQFHQDYPVFWRTNVDRNAIWDAVQNARSVVEPPQPVTAGLKELSELDYMEKTAMIGSGGQLVEVYPGDTYMNYDGQPTTLPQPTLHRTPDSEQESKHYAANVEIAGKIIGSVSVEVESSSKRDGHGDHHVTIHDAWVDPDHGGSDVWLKLYRWVRQHWPQDRLFGDFANEDLSEFFNRDNRESYLGDDDGWADTGIGTGGSSESQPNWQPSVYAKTAAAAQYDSIFPVPERMLPQFGLEPVPGGRYMIPQGPPNQWQEATDQVRPGGMLQITPDGKPQFHVQQGEAEPPGRAHGILTRVNLFKQKAGWRWNDAGHEPMKTLISVEHGPHHYYALRTTFNSPVHLRTYPGKSEPRLRPTTRGDLDFGNVVNTIRLRGREHPVYDHIEVNPRRATERVGAFGDPDQQRLERERPAQADFSGRAPWYLDTEGNPVIGNWGQFHHEIGGYNKSPYNDQASYLVKGDVDKDGQVSVYHQLDRQFTPEEQQQIADHIHQPLRSRFGFGFHPQLRLNEPVETNFYDFSAPAQPPAAPQAPVSDSQPLRSRLKGIARRAVGMASEGVTGLPDYYLAGPQEGELHMRTSPALGMAQRLPDGTWASWSGWPDAYRFVSNPEGYLEQPEQAIGSGHGWGHPGLNMQWRHLWPDKTRVNIAHSGHVAGWHIPMRDGTRGVVMYTSGHGNLGAVGDMLAQIEAHHGAPARIVEDREYLDPRQALIQHPHGSIIMPPMAWRMARDSGAKWDDWYRQYLEGGQEMAQPQEPEGFDFSAPAPAPRR